MAYIVSLPSIAHHYPVRHPYDVSTCLSEVENKFILLM